MIREAKRPAFDVRGDAPGSSSFFICRRKSFGFA